MRSTVVGVVGVMVAACGFPPEASSPKPVAQIAAPTTLQAKPLKVGQWVLYREHVGHEDVGTVRFAVVAEAPCGTWIEAALVGGSNRRTWRFCVTADHRITEATLNDEAVIVERHDDELPSLLTRVLPPLIAGRFVREQLWVPAGHFEGTLRVDGATTTWLHPDVPLGAVVQVTAGARQDVLVAYGDEPAPAHEREPREAFRAQRRPSTSYELAYGQGSWSGAPSGESSTVDALRFGVGFRAGATVDVILAGESADNRRYVMTDAMASTAGLLSAGVRWHLFGRAPAIYNGFEIGNLPYVEATAGLSYLKRGSETGGGVGATAAIGWELVRGAGWAAGFRGDYTELEPLAGQVARRHVLEGGVLVRLQLP